MATIKVKQTLAFENRLLKVGETTNINSQDAKTLVDNGLAEIVADEDDAPEEKKGIKITHEKEDGSKEVIHNEKKKVEEPTKKEVEEPKKETSITITKDSDKKETPKAKK